MFNFFYLYLLFSSCDFVKVKYYKYYPDKGQQIAKSVKNNNLQQAMQLAIQDYSKEALSLNAYFNLAYTLARQDTTNQNNSRASSSSYHKINTINQHSANGQKPETKTFKLAILIYKYILKMTKPINATAVINSDTNHIRFWSLFNLAVIKQKHNDIRQALHFYQKALSVTEKSILKKHKQVKINIELLLNKKHQKNQQNQKSDKKKQNQNTKKNQKQGQIQNNNNKQEQKKNNNSQKQKPPPNTAEQKQKTSVLLSDKNIEQILKNIRLQETTIYEQMQNKNKKQGTIDAKDW